MILDSVVADLRTAVLSVIRALSNNLSARDNFAPDGTSGQVLTSNGSGRPPSYQNIDAKVLEILRKQGLI
jgi:hypothetical protein